MPRKKRPIEDELAGFRDRLTAWRQAHRPRSPLPEEIWREAIMLARRYGVHRTARALPMDYKLLRQRVAAVTKPAKFVEVVVRTAATTTPAPECVMEWEGSGGRLRLELKAMPVDEIARLARALTAA